jgi:hypothetical protein
MAPAAAFTDQQIFTLIVLERTGGCLSLAAVFSIFIFYGLFKRLRTIPNTFLVFASIANVGASIPSVIAYSGIWKGTQSDLCQAQGFLFEMYVPCFLSGCGRAKLVPCATKCNVMLIPCHE